MSDRTGQGAFRAQPRPLEQRLPFRNGGRESWHSQIDLEAAAIIQHGGVAADREGNLGLTTGDINANRRARRIGIGRRAIRLLDLKQFHDLTNTLWTSAVSAACGRGCPRSGYRRSMSLNVERLAAAATAL